MNRKSMIALIMGFAFVSIAIGAIAGPSLPDAEFGGGTATVSNTAPTLTGIGINSGSGWVSYLDVSTTYYFYVNVSDINSLNDIASVTMEIFIPTYETSTSPMQRYKFRYDEANLTDGVFGGTWTQLVPNIADGDFIDEVASQTPISINSTSGSYVFATSLIKTATATEWRFYATVTDSVGATATREPKMFNVYKYMEMDFNTGDGHNFAWIGSPGQQDVADTFTVSVTSNAPYILSAAYENRFYNGTIVWANDPVLEIQYFTNPKVPLQNVSSNYVDWRSFSTPTTGQQVTTHTLYLDFEQGLPALEYKGVTIYIQARV